MKKKMTQEEFSSLCEKYSLISHEIGRLQYGSCGQRDMQLELDKLAEKIAEARECDSLTLMVKDEETFVVVHVTVLDDDSDSPDGVSYYYDDYTVTQDGTEEFNGGCYYGFISPIEMLKFEGYDLERMKDVSWSNEMSDMVADGEFDYAKLNKIWRETK